MAAILLDEGEAEIDGRVDAAAAEDAVRLRDEAFGLPQDARVAPPELIDERPVGRRGAPVEQARLGDHRHARADRRDARAAHVPAAEPRHERGVGAPRFVEVDLGRGHDDEIGVAHRAERALGLHAHGDHVPRRASVERDGAHAEAGRGRQAVELLPQHAHGAEDLDGGHGGRGQRALEEHLRDLDVAGIPGGGLGGHG